MQPYLSQKKKKKRPTSRKLPVFALVADSSSSTPDNFGHSLAFSV